MKIKLLSYIVITHRNEVFIHRLCIGPMWEVILQIINI